MKTPHFVKEINGLEYLKKIGDLSIDREVALSEYKSIKKLLTIPVVGTHVCVKCKTDKVYIDETSLCKKCLLKIYDQAN